MPTIQEALDDLVANTTGLQNTVSGRITDMDGKIVQASSAKADAETAKLNAEIAETSAQTAQSLAETARDVANTAKVDAQSAKSDALTAQSAASSAQTSAEAARDASIAADVSASTHKTDSQTAKNAAVVAQGNAETAETNASTSASAANAHKIKAGQWADAAEDTEVESGVYSAKHYMAKAAIENTAAGVSEVNAGASASAASSSEGVATTKASESSASATASASSASTATTKAAEGVASASSASGSASAATTKASEASSSATAAASSASSAASAATTAVNAVIDTAPANLNTLNELAAALGDDANYASTTTTALGNRYTKSETDSKIVALSPPTDISGKFDKAGGTIAGNTEIQGSIKLGDDTRAGASTPAGTLRWNNGKLQNSTGSEWQDVSYTPKDGSTAEGAADGPVALKNELGSGAVSGNYYINFAHGPERVYIDFTLDSGRGFVIMMGYHFTSGTQRFPGNTYEYLLSGSGNGGYSNNTSSAFTGGNGWRTGARLDPSWFSGINGHGLVTETNDNGSAAGGIASSNCYAWIRWSTSASSFINMFDHTPGQSDHQNQIYGANNSTTAGSRGNGHWRSGHGTSGGVHQMGLDAIVNSSCCMEFLANFGSDPNHSWLVNGNCSSNYRNGGGNICDFNNRWANLGFSW